MSNRVRQILDRIAALEDELHAAIEERESRLRYQIEGRRVVFEHAISEAHQRVKPGVFRWYCSICVPASIRRSVSLSTGSPGCARGLHRAGSSASGLPECHREDTLRVLLVCRRAARLCVRDHGAPDSISARSSTPTKYSARIHAMSASRVKARQMTTTAGLNNSVPSLPGRRAKQASRRAAACRMGATQPSDRFSGGS